MVEEKCESYIPSRHQSQSLAPKPRLSSTQQKTPAIHSDKVGVAAMVMFAFVGILAVIGAFSSSVQAQTVVTMSIVALTIAFVVFTTVGELRRKPSITPATPPAKSVTSPAHSNKAEALPIALAARMALVNAARGFGDEAIATCIEIDGQLKLLSELMPGQEHTAAYSAVADLLENDMPKLVACYQSVPEQFRNQTYLGQTPENILEAGLRRIHARLEELSNQLRQIPLDNLAIHGRFLENLHGNGVPLKT